MNRRFNVESLSAGEALLRADAANAAAYSRRVRGGVSCQFRIDRALRAERLLLAWWAWGHDPSRHILACPACSGVAILLDAVTWYECDVCDGSGRRP